MPENGSSIWLVAREYEGWASAGGVKDVVHDMARAFTELGWQVHVCLPLYGFLKERVFHDGQRSWRGKSQHPVFRQEGECWTVSSGNLQLHFFRFPSVEHKQGIYTVTLEEQNHALKLVHGNGYPDTFRINLEFQWMVAEFWFQNALVPAKVLVHDGHCAFLPVISKASPFWKGHFAKTQFFVLIHNAGQGYRQEMPVSVENQRLLGLPEQVLKDGVWEQTWDPLVMASAYARLATVSENYAQELLTGKNDFYSGSFGRFLRENQIPLEGITNGFDPYEYDPRFPHRSGIPYRFDPSRGDWLGKDSCRNSLMEAVLWKTSHVHGFLANWRLPLYVFQSRLTSQKGVDDLRELLEQALGSEVPVNFLVMGVGEERYEKNLIQLAFRNQDSERFLFLNFYEESLARLVFASADFFLMPSLYEPCGLTDLKAQLMGALPIVAKVGGLVKVKDGQTGFCYDRGKERGLWEVFLRSRHLALHRPDLLEIMRRQAFRSCLSDFRWQDILVKRYLPWMSNS